MADQRGGGIAWIEIDALHGTHGLLRPHGGTNDRLDWIVIGGESGKSARPFDLAWALSTIEQCKEAGTKVFFKQAGARPVLDGAPLKLRHRAGGDLAELPAELRVQEFPGFAALPTSACDARAYK